MNTATAAAATQPASRHASRRFRSVCFKTSHFWLSARSARDISSAIRPTDLLNSCSARSAVTSAVLIRLARQIDRHPPTLQQHFDPPDLVVAELPRRLFYHRAGPLDPRSQLPFRLNQDRPKRLDAGPLPPNVHGMRTQRVEPLVAQRFIHVAKHLAKLREAIRPDFHDRHGNHSPTRASLASIRLIHVLTTH